MRRAVASPRGRSALGRISRSLVRLTLWLVLLIGLASPATAQIFVFEDEDGIIHFTDNPHHAGFKRKLPASGTSLVRRRAPTPAAAEDRYDSLILRASRTYRLSPGLVKAMIHVESRFDPTAVSHKGARGLMQLMPATAGELGVADVFNPWQNIEGGTRYLHQLVRQFDGDLTLGLAAYHAGPGNVARHGGIPPFRTTRNYIRRVLKLYRQYHADFR